MSILKGSIIQNAIFDFINIILRRSSIFVVFLGGRTSPLGGPASGAAVYRNNNFDKIKTNQEKDPGFQESI
jgi:hypothetical protein